MSGGVDSSVAAYLLKRSGHCVIGIFLRCWSGPDAGGVGVNCAERDAEDARRVAEVLKIPFYVWDFEREYEQKVVEYMVQGYREGITPNPDVACNREIKFGLFLKRAKLLGADHVATGHYARIKSSKSGMKDGREYRLSAAKDKNKDQSYFLWTLTQRDLKHVLFPIGVYLKSEVREIARRANLPTAEKKDSQGICFLGKITIEDFLRSYISPKKGAVLSVKNEILGEHEGAHLYTVGQRRGIGNIKHQKGMNTHKPLYVSAKDMAMNTVTVAEENDHKALCRDTITLKNINWVSRAPRDNEKILVRTRYRQALREAVFKKDGKNCILKFTTPQRFVAPGQSAVVYVKSGEMLGGGVIL